MSSRKTVVAVRLVNAPEQQEPFEGIEDSVVSIPAENTVRVVQPPKQSNQDNGLDARDYNFDYVYAVNATELEDDHDGEACEHESLLHRIGSVPVQRCLSGESSLVFAYGASATGKSYALIGNEDNPGLLPRMFQSVFEALADIPEHYTASGAAHAEVHCCQVLGDAVYDLLAPTRAQTAKNPKRGGGSGSGGGSGGGGSGSGSSSSGGGGGGGGGGSATHAESFDDPGERRRVRESPRHGAFVEGLTEVVVRTDWRRAFELLREAQRRRTRASFSRRCLSHLIFTFNVKGAGGVSSQSKNQQHGPVTGQIQFVSFAPIVPTMAKMTTSTRGTRSSPRVPGKSPALKAAERDIGTSLSTLHRVVGALAKQKKHVPFRDSMLTRLLKRSLSGRAHTTLLATITPDRASVADTMSTLRFAANISQLTVASNLRLMPASAVKTALLQEIKEIEHELQQQAHAGGHPGQAPPGGGGAADAAADSGALVEDGGPKSRAQVLLEEVEEDKKKLRDEMERLRRELDLLAGLLDIDALLSIEIEYQSESNRRRGQMVVSSYLPSSESDEVVSLEGSSLSSFHDDDGHREDSPAGGAAQPDLNTPEDAVAMSARSSAQPVGKGSGGITTAGLAPAAGIASTEDMEKLTNAKSLRLTDTSEDGGGGGGGGELQLDVHSLHSSEAAATAEALPQISQQQRRLAGSPAIESIFASPTQNGKGSNTKALPSNVSPSPPQAKRTTRLPLTPPRAAPSKEPLIRKGARNQKFKEAANEVRSREAANRRAARNRVASRESQFGQAATPQRNGKRPSTPSSKRPPAPRSSANEDEEQASPPRPDTLDDATKVFRELLKERKSQKEAAAAALLTLPAGGEDDCENGDAKSASSAPENSRLFFPPAHVLESSSDEDRREGTTGAAAGVLQESQGDVLKQQPHLSQQLLHGEDQDQERAEESAASNSGRAARVDYGDSDGTFQASNASRQWKADMSMALQWAEKKERNDSKRSGHEGGEVASRRNADDRPEVSPLPMLQKMPNDSLLFENSTSVEWVVTPRDDPADMEGAMAPAPESPRPFWSTEATSEAREESFSSPASGERDLSGIQRVDPTWYDRKPPDANAKEALFLRAVQRSRNDEAIGIYDSGGVSLNAVNSFGRNAVHIAARNGNLRLLKWLGDNFADFHLVSMSGDTAFHVATWNGHVTCMEYLFNKHGLDCEARTVVEEDAPAHLAARRGELKALKWLTRMGVGLWPRNKHGLTPLHQTPLCYEAVRTFLRARKAENISTAKADDA